MALVPTMGALHAGHIALIEAARLRADTVAATHLRQPDCSSAPARISTAIRGRKRPTRRCCEAAGCDLLWMPTAAEMYPEGFATNGQRVGRQRALGRRGAARPFRRRGDGGRQAADRRAARCRLVRRKGFPATGGDPPDGRRPRAWRWRSSACRRCATPTAWRCRRATPIFRAEERQRALALPQGAAGGARSEHRSTAKPVAATSGRVPKRRWSTPDLPQIDYFALVDADTLEPLDEPRGDDAADRRGDDRRRHA